MTAPLKPCPFCSGHLVPRFPGWFDHPKSKCILSGKAFHKGYIGQWNTRADAPELTALVATMKKMREAWENALELGLLPEQHRMSAQILRDDAANAVKQYEALQ